MVSTSTSSQPEASLNAAEGYDYGQVHIERAGPDDGPPVVLLHGWGSNTRLMQPLADGLADMYYVVNIDLPGHGVSPPPPEAWGVPEHAALVAKLIRNEARPPVTIVGHSNGGRIALYMASDPAYASLIQRLVLISPSGITPPRSWTYYFRKYLAQILKAPFSILPAPLREPGLDWLRHSLVWKLLGSSDYRALQGVMRETFVKTVNCYLDDRIGRIQAPTLVFWGDRDEAVSRHQMQVLEEKIPDAGLVVLEGAGHYGHLDDPATVLAGMRYFLEQRLEDGEKENGRTGEREKGGG